MPRPDDIRPGEVWLVGAGPGDPDLLTRKAERLIAQADVVFYDALVGPGILDLAGAGAERISVGKRSGRHSKDQASINELLLQAARSGRRVVRLKGGDPSIFGRSAEEIAHLTAAGVAVRICPGITAASAAAASGTISLTRRGTAQALTFVTAHARSGSTLDLDWPALAQSGTTLAIYMGRESAGEVARRLIAAGRAADTPVLIAADVSGERERLFRTRLDSLGRFIRTIGETSPTLVIVGEVVDEGSDAASRSGPELATLLH